MHHLDFHPDYRSFHFPAIACRHLQNIPWCGSNCTQKNKTSFPGFRGKREQNLISGSPIGFKTTFPENLGFCKMYFKINLTIDLGTWYPSESSPWSESKPNSTSPSPTGSASKASKCSFSSTRASANKLWGNGQVRLV